MNNALCIFEDNQTSNLNPLVLTRPVYDLRCGILTLREKIQERFAGYTTHLHCRKYLENVLKENNPHLEINNLNSDSCLFINGRIIFDDEIVGQFSSQNEIVLLQEKSILGAFLKGNNIKKFLSYLNGESDLPNLNVETKNIKGIKLIEYPWDLVNLNSQEIIRDYDLIGLSGIYSNSISDYSVITDISKIYIGKDTRISAGVIINSETGPVFIGDGVTLMPNSVIEGPAFIGNNSIVKISSKIYEGTSIGNHSKVGGEIEGSIIHSHSNKQHDGFLGHAYLGQWVNLGADTNNSDLKNNYSSVRVSINGKEIDSGSMFAGLYMGDHSKTAINTMFNTGTVVGVMSNIFGEGFPSKYIPSFSWGGSKGFTDHQIDKALETAKIVMERRNVTLTDNYKEMIKVIYDNTLDERI